MYQRKLILLLRTLNIVVAWVRKVENHWRRPSISSALLWKKISRTLDLRWEHVSSAVLWPNKKEKVKVLQLKVRLYPICTHDWRIGFLECLNPLPWLDFCVSNALRQQQEAWRLCTWPCFSHYSLQQTCLAVAQILEQTAQASTDSTFLHVRCTSA